jgi:hypothetical protein
VLAGDRYLYDLFGGRIDSPFAWASLAVVGVAVAAGLWWLRGRRRWLLALGATMSLAYYLIPLFNRGTISLYPSHPWLLASTRYIYLPVLFLLTALAFAADRGTRERRRPAIPEIAFVLLLFGTMATSYAAPHRTEGSPSWRTSVAQARVACKRQQNYGLVTVYYNRGLIAVLPISPPEHWRALIGCSRLK